VEQIVVAARVATLPDVPVAAHRLAAQAVEQAARVPADSAPVGEARLLDHVAMVRFAYFGPPRPGEGATWLEQWTDRDRLPQLVRVVIEREGSRFSAWPELVVATRITGNAGCVYDALSSTCRRTR